MAQHAPRVGVPFAMLGHWLPTIWTLISLVVASFFVWLFAQTPQIVTNYKRKSVDGLSGVFIAQWMSGDVLNLIGSLLTHQLPFQIAVATYFCAIDVCILFQFIYYTMIYPRPASSPTQDQQTRVGRYGRRRRPRLSETGYGTMSHSRARPGPALASDMHNTPNLMSPNPTSEGQHEGAPLLPKSRDGFRPLRWMLKRRTSLDRDSASDEERQEEEDQSGHRGRGMTRTATIVASRQAGQVNNRPAQMGRSQSASESPAPDNDMRTAQSQALSGGQGILLGQPRSSSALPGPYGRGTPTDKDRRPRSRRRQASRPTGPTLVLLAAGVLFTARSLPRSTPSSASDSATAVVGWTPASTSSHLPDLDVLSAPLSPLTWSSSDLARQASAPWSISSLPLLIQDEWVERVVGRISAWFCTLLYMTSRLPQIYVNLTRRSVEGLSIMLFLSAFLGNTLYTASVLLNPSASGPSKRSYLLESLPFLLGSGGTLIFDLIIVAQWVAWRGNVPHPIAYVQKTSSRRASLSRDASVTPLGRATSRGPDDPDRYRYARHRSLSMRRSLNRASASIPRSSSRPSLLLSSAPSTGRVNLAAPTLPEAPIEHKSS